MLKRSLEGGTREGCQKTERSRAQQRKGGQDECGGLEVYSLPLMREKWLDHLMRVGRGSGREGRLRRDLKELPETMGRPRTEDPGRLVG